MEQHSRELPIRRRKPRVAEPATEAIGQVF
jgi:hypothetical protein